MSTLDVHVVTPEREVWAGRAAMVIARSVTGELGVLPEHEPTLACLAVGPLRVDGAEGGTVHAAVDGGFLSVSRTNDGGTRVDVLAERVDLAKDIDAAAVHDLEAQAEERRAAGDEDGANDLARQAEVRRGLLA
jgi:F-type H+-transporting ATPase subunit epsilon